jgi:co-chaperonin GroES (HSP10)
MRAVTGKVVIQSLEQYKGKEKIEDGIVIPETIVKKRLNTRLTLGKILSIISKDSDEYGLRVDDEVLFDTLSASYQQLENGQVAIPVESVIMVKK